MNKSTIKTWLIASNLKTYNSLEAFEYLNELCWNEKQVYFKTGDIVYIYIAAPISAISIKCEVTATSLSTHDIDDHEYWKDKKEFTDSLENNTWMKLKLIDIFKGGKREKLKGKVLKNHGLKAGFVFGRQQANFQLLEYIKKIESTAA